VINQNQATVIEPILLNIARIYPQALFYPFKLLESNTQVGIPDQAVSTKTLFRRLAKYFENFKNLNSWLEGLNSLIYPEHRFKYWHQIVLDVIQNKQPKELLDSVCQMALYDLVEADKQYVEDKVGEYN